MAEEIPRLAHSTAPAGLPRNDVDAVNQEQFFFSQASECACHAFDEDLRRRPVHDVILTLRLVKTGTRIFGLRFARLKAAQNDESGFSARHHNCGQRHIHTEARPRGSAPSPTDTADQS